MLKMMTGSKTARFFYLNREKVMEIYTIMNGALFRFVYEKADDMKDSLFYETYLKDSVPILGMGHVNEDEWRAAFNALADRVGNLESLLEKPEAE